MTTVRELADAADFRLHADGGTEQSVTGATIRAQDAGPGIVFAALAGASAHGARFAHLAAEAGAVAIVTDDAGYEIARADGLTVPVLVHSNPREILGALSARVNGEPSTLLDVVGITGTSGKTTTSYFVEAAVAGCHLVAGVIGTTGSRVAGTSLHSRLTTPEAPEFQALLATMRRVGAHVVAAEVSSHALRLGRVDGTRFAVGAFLNLSQDHLDFHPTMDDYFAAKGRLFDREIDPGSQVMPAERAVIVIDDQWGRSLARHRPDAVTVTGKIGGHAHWSASVSVPGSSGGQKFTVTGPNAGTFEVEIPLLGRFNVTNALVALAIAEALDMDVRQAAEGLARVRVPGRLEPVERGQDFRVLVDYAHKPAAVEAVLASVREQTQARIAVVLGAGGDRDRGKRALMGQAAAQIADLVVVTDDNPRSEDPAAIRAEVRAGAQSVDRSEVEIREVGDRGRAIAEAIDWAKSGDIVLIAGKGHETGQDIGGTVLPFDDRVHAAVELDRRLGLGPDHHQREDRTP